jgi:hypothetical protein
MITLGLGPSSFFTSNASLYCIISKKEKKFKFEFELLVLEKPANYGKPDPRISGPKYPRMEVIIFLALYFHLD